MLLSVIHGLFYSMIVPCSIAQFCYNLLFLWLEGIWVAYMFCVFKIMIPVDTGDRTGAIFISLPDRWKRQFEQVESVTEYPCWFLYFWERVSLYSSVFPGFAVCRPCWLQTHRDPHSHTSHVLELKACITTSGPSMFIFYSHLHYLLWEFVLGIEQPEAQRRAVIRGPKF